MESEFIIFGGAALGGAISVAMGYLEKRNIVSFDKNRAIAGIIRGAIGGFIAVLGTIGSSAEPNTFATAVLFGIGSDTIINKGNKIMRGK